MSRQPVLPPENQYSILSTFSPNTAENINKIMRVVLGSPPVIGQNPIVTDVYDLESELIDRNCVCSGNAFEMIKINDTTIRVGIGRCFISGVLIETKETIDLIVTQGDNYLYQPSDTKPVSDGSYYISVVVKYTPTEPDPNAYIGLINNVSSYYTPNTEDLCFLGVVKVDISGGIVIIDDIYYSDPISGLTRLQPLNLMDGGWIGEIPLEYTI